MRRMSMSRLSCRPMCLVVGVAASVLMPLAAWAQSAVPAALDRVPAEAPLMISMRNVGSFVTNVEAFTKKLPKMGRNDPMAGIKELRDVLALPGVNSEGSAAIAIMSVGDEEKGEDHSVAIVPVKDYAAFAKALGGTGSGTEEVKYSGEKFSIKSLEGGFAALGKNKALVEKFAGKAGNGAAIDKMLGANGKAASEGKDAVIIANLPALAPNIKKGMEGARQQMKEMAAMGGQAADAAKGNIAMMEWMETGLTRDGQAGVMGVNLGEKGITLDLAGQFKEGSEWGTYFTGKAKGGALAGLLPNDAYLFAFVIDSSSAGLKKLVGKMGAMQKEMGGAGMFGDMNPTAMFEKADAVGFFMGESPAPIGGLLLNTGMVVRSSDAAGIMKDQVALMKAANGKSQGGITMATTIKEGSDKVGELAVTEWGMKMQADPNNPAGAQIAQIQAMIFGPQGMGGYMAAGDGSMVMTYSKNKDLVGKLAASAKSGAGLSSEAGVKMVGAELPKDRSMEGYIGIKSILNTAQGFMGMMGGGNFVVPESIPPVGFGGTTDNAGVRAAMYVPMDVIKAFADLGKSMGGGGGEEPMDEEKGHEEKDGAGQPKF